MDEEAIEESLGNVLREDNHRPKKLGEYHPSQVTGCPLKTFLDWMTENHSGLNHWLFSGSAVHFYLQEKSNLLSEALKRAGYHPLDTKYEVRNRTNIGGGVNIVGTCDILTHDGEDTIILDIKYSSVKPSSGRGRMWSYLSQVNTYSYMFGADEYGLLLIYNRADSIPDEINVVSNSPSEDNWELVKEKARSIDDTLYDFGYQDGRRFKSDNMSATDDIWTDVLSNIDKTHCPSYKQECKYCDHKEYCPVKQGKVGGLKGMGK